MNTTAQYISAIVAIIAIGLLAAVMDPERSVAILAFCSSVVVSLLVMLNGYREVHDSVNSKMDRLLAVVEASALAKGRLEGAQQQREENNKT